MELALKKYKEDVRSAAVSALNKMGQRAKTRISSEVRAKYNLRKDYLDDLLVMKKATFNNLTVEIKAKTKKIGLDHFGKPSQGSRGVIVEITKGKPVELRVKPKATSETEGHGTAYRGLQKGTIGTFIARRARGVTYGGGDETVFARQGKKNYPLRRVVGPSAADLAGAKFIQQVIKEAYETEFPKLLEHEIQYYSQR